MPTFERCDKSVNELATKLFDEYETHKPLVACGVNVDFVFAYADCDDKGRPLNDALTKGGLKALGIARKLPLKERALGRGDAEVALDGDWWKLATAEQQAALLDHELHHIAVKCDKSGNPQFDDLGRPQIKLRKHDIEFGWFKCIAERHGDASQERIQAKSMMDLSGQYFWPELAPTVELVHNGQSSGKMAIGAFAKAASTIARGTVRA